MGFSLHRIIFISLSFTYIWGLFKIIFIQFSNNKIKVFIYFCSINPTFITRHTSDEPKKLFAQPLLYNCPLYWTFRQCCQATSLQGCKKRKGYLIPMTAAGMLNATRSYIPTTSEVFKSQLWITHSTA